MEKWILCLNAKFFDVHPSNATSKLAQFLFSKLVLNYTFLTVLSHTLILLVLFIPASSKARIFISFKDEWISGILVMGYHTNQKPHQSSSSSVVNFIACLFPQNPHPHRESIFVKSFNFMFIHSWNITQHNISNTYMDTQKGTFFNRAK